MNFSQKVVVGLLLISTSSYAAKHSSEYDKQYKRIQKIEKIGNRKVAESNNLSITEQFFNQNRKETRTLRDEVFAISSSAQLDGFLAKVDSNYNSYKEIDAKFYAIQLASQRPFRSILWRLETMIGSRIGDGRLDTTNMTQNMFISGVGAISSFNNTLIDFSNSQYWKTGFKYSSEPHEFSFKKLGEGECSNHKNKKYENWGQTFSNEVELKDFLSCEVYPSLVEAEKRLADLIIAFNQMPSDYKIIWDSKILFGADSFDANLGNDRERFRKIGSIELNSLMAALKQSKMSLEMLMAYNIDDVVEINNRLGKKMAEVGVRFTAFSTNDALLSHVRAEVLRDHKNFLTKETRKFAGANAETWMARSLSSLEEWFEYANLARLETDRTANSVDPQDQQLLFNPAGANPLLGQMEISFESMERLIFNDGPQVLTSQVTGEYIEVDFRKLFKSPHTDLKDFLPTQFDTKDGIYSKKIKGKKYKFRNYNYGMATSWNKNVYQKYFNFSKPGSNEKGKELSNEDLKRAARVTTQAWGGVLLVGGLINFL